MADTLRQRRQRRRRRTIAARQAYRPRGAGGSVWTNRWAGLTVLAVLVAIGLLYALYLSPVFALKTVEVKGADDQKAVIAAAAKDGAVRHFGAFQTSSLASADAGRITAAIKAKVPTIATTDVHKKWPNKLQITVTMRQLGLIWKSGANRYLIDQNGVAYTTTDRTDAVTVEDIHNLPVTVGKPVVGAQFIRVLLEIQQGMQNGGIKVTSFRVPETTFEVQAVTDAGYYALFDTTRPVASQVNALLTAIRTNPKPSQYADLRVPGRVYLR